MNNSSSANWFQFSKCSNNKVNGRLSKGQMTIQKQYWMAKQQFEQDTRQLKFLLKKISS